MDQSAIVGAIVLAGLAIFGYARMFTSGRTAKRLKALLPSSTVVDVRTNEEYRNGHFAGAVNIPVDKLSKSGKRLGDKSSPIILYCASGARARQAARVVRAMGYSKVLVGGTLTQMEKITAK